VNQREDVNRWLATVAKLSNPRVMISAIVALGEGLKQSHNDLLSWLLQDASSPVGQMFNRLFVEARQMARDSEALADTRQDAIALLGYGRFEDVQELPALLEARQPQEVQLAIVRALARQKQPDVAPCC